MAFSFDPDNEDQLNDMFEELRGMLLQLERKRVQAVQQSEEIVRVKSEKSTVGCELENLKIVLHKVQSELNAVTKTSQDSEKQINELRVDIGRLRRENAFFKSENEKLAVTQKNMMVELAEAQRKHNNDLEKISIWHKIHEEVSLKQAQNQAVMLETAKQIGHAKATTLYIHHLKQQVELVYKNGLETIKHLWESQEKSEQGSSKKNVWFDESIEAGRKKDQESSGWNSSEHYLKCVDEKLRAELQGYKEELWTGLHALSQLSDIKGAEPDLN